MVKKLCWKSPHKTNYFLFKLTISALLVGLAFWLIHNRSSAVSGSYFLKTKFLLILKKIQITFLPKRPHLSLISQGLMLFVSVQVLVNRLHFVAKGSVITSIDIKVSIFVLCISKYYEKVQRLGQSP